MPLIFLFFYLVFSQVEGFQSRFTSLPSKPTVSHVGKNVTLVWKFHLSLTDRAHLKSIEFGLWSDGGVSTVLVTLVQNESFSIQPERVVWMGTNRSAVFQINNVTLNDGGVYGCNLDFGAFAVRDFVRLVIIAPPRIKKAYSGMTEVSVSEGHSVVIPCEVTGNPPPRVTWTRNGKILQNRSGISNLTVKSAARNMTGVYTCKARNQAGSDKLDVLLLVQSCQHQPNGANYHPPGDMPDHDDQMQLHSTSTATPTLVVAFVIFIIFTVYFFFRCTGSKNNKFRTYNRVPKDEQARSLMGEWSTFTDSGEKI